MAANKTKKNPTPQETILQVTNWMRETKDGVIQIRSAEEAIKHFNLKVKPRDIQGWLSRRNLSSKQLYEEAIALKQKETVETFIKMGEVRKTLHNRANNMILNLTGFKKDDNGDFLYDPKGNKILKSADKDLMEGIIKFRKVIDLFTGWEDLEKLQNMANQLDGKLKEFNQKKKIDKRKMEQEDRELDIKEKQMLNHDSNLPIPIFKGKQELED